jgi:hypothetical protein
MLKPKPSKPVLLAFAFQSFYAVKAIAVVICKHFSVLGGSFVVARKQLHALRDIAVVILMTLVFAVTYLVAMTPTTAAAAANATLNFQARLESSSGAIAPDGTYTISFHLFNAASSSGSTDTGCGSDANCEWTEEYTGGNAIHVANGYLTVNLGSITAFPSTINWGQQQYLTIDIYNSGTSSWDGQMSPRLPLTAVPSAFAVISTINSGGYNSTLSLTQPGSGVTGNENFVVPDMGAAGTYTLLTSGNAVQLQNSTPGTQQTGYFNISGTGLLSTLDATGGSGSTLTIGATDTYTGAINIGTSASVTSGTVSIGGSAQTGTITVGQATTATSQTINIESANGTASTQTVNIANGTSTTSGGKTVNIATGTPGTSTTNAVNIGSGGTTTGTVTVTIGSNGAAAHVTTIQGGNGTGASPAIKIQPNASGDIDLGVSSVGGAVVIGGTAETGTITLGQTSGGNNTINIGAAAGNTYTQTINIGTSTTTGSKTAITVGSTIGASSLTLQTGTGALNLNSTTSSTGTINIGSTSAGALTVTSGAASTIKTNAGNLTLQAGSGTVTLGSSTNLTSSGALTIQSGGANTLSLDTGSGAAINIGPTNATSITVGGNSSGTITDKVANSSATAYELQTAGGTALLVADSTNNSLYVGGSSAASSPTLLVVGQYNGNSYPAEQDGAIFYDQNSRSFQCGENGNWSSCTGGVVFSNPTGTVLWNYGGGNAAGTGVEPTATQWTMPYNDCQKGVVYNLFGSGYITVASPTGTLVYFYIYENGSPVSKAVAHMPTGSATKAWVVNVEITCESTTSVLLGGYITIGEASDNEVDYFGDSTGLVLTGAISSGWANNAGGTDLGPGLGFNNSCGSGTDGMAITQWTVSRSGP